MPSLNASLGLAQVRNLKKIKFQKKKLFLLYNRVISNFSGLKLFKEHKFTDSNYWLQVLILEGKNKKLRDNIVREGVRQNFRVSTTWKLASSLKPYKNKQKMDLTGSKKIYDSIVCVPSGGGVIF